MVWNLCFDKKVETTCNDNKNKEVFIQGMKTSTTVRLGDPQGLRTVAVFVFDSNIKMFPFLLKITNISFLKYKNSDS